VNVSINIPVMKAMTRNGQGIATMGRSVQGARSAHGTTVSIEGAQTARPALA
jgi:hypothetical protein